MFYIFKALLLLILLETYCCVSFAREVTDSECSAGVCTFHVLSDNLVVSPCKGYSVLVAYSESSGSTAIQCSSPIEESKVYLFNRDGNLKEGYLLEGGRFLSSDSFPALAAEGVPDKFAPVPLCNKLQVSSWGEIIIAEKDINDSGDPPYCYRINRIKSSGDGLVVVTEAGRKPRLLPEAQIKRWTKIRTLLLGYISKKAVQDSTSGLPGRKAIVQATRAPLYSSSTSAAKTSKYLIKGDEVAILTSGANTQDWVRIRYITKTGKIVEDWLQARDLKLVGVGDADQ